MNRFKILESSSAKHGELESSSPWLRPSIFRAHYGSRLQAHREPVLNARETHLEVGEGGGVGAKLLLDDRDGVARLAYADTVVAAVANRVSLRKGGNELVFLV